MPASPPTIAPMHATTPAPRPGWRRLALAAFACINLAAIGIFFAVFIGVVIAPPRPRNVTYILVAGALAFAVLAMGQFVWWSVLALRHLKARQP